jgi:hypothetical protein
VELEQAQLRQRRRYGWQDSVYASWTGQLQLSHAWQNANEGRHSVMRRDDGEDCQLLEGRGWAAALYAVGDDTPVVSAGGIAAERRSRYLRHRLQLEWCAVWGEAERP